LGAESARCFPAQFIPIDGKECLKWESGKQLTGQQSDYALPEYDNTLANHRCAIHNQCKCGFHAGEKDT
jgi:hypothetical protein